VGNKVYGGQASHSATQAEHGRRDPAYLRFLDHPVPGDSDELVRRFSPRMYWLKDVGAALSPGQPIYVLLYASAIIFFCFFYTALGFQLERNGR
jgi:preprotein translocase subunit SecY